MHGAITGEYPVTGTPEEASLVLAHAYGTATYPGSVNSQIADLASRYSTELRVPFVAEHDVTDALYEGKKPDYIIGGSASNTFGKGGGSFGAIAEAADYIAERRLYSDALIIGHARHVGRVAVQAQIFGINPILVPGMPRGFDTDSEQWWTRSPKLWLARELPFIFYVSLQKIASR